MADVKWIKLAVDMFDNRKIRQIETLPDGDGIIVIWVKLLCLAGVTNDGGLIYFTRDIPYTEQMLAAYFQRPIALVQMALRVFQQFGMIELVDDLIMVSGWEKYQNLDRLAELREKERIKKQKYREKQRLLQSPEIVPGTVHGTAPGQVTQCPATDIDKEEDIDRDIEYMAQAPTPPEGKTTKSSKPKSEIKHKHGEYGWVQLTDEQYNKLLQELGQAELDRCIAYIDESAQSSSNKNRWKDWNLVIRRCHREGWGLRGQQYSSAAKQPEGSGNPFADYLRNKQNIVGAYDYQEDKNNEY